jgi:hypothetical protein
MSGFNMASAKAPSTASKLPFTSNGLPPMEDIDRSILSDDRSPVDRRSLNEQFHVIMSRYRLDQTKFAECAGVSGATISTICTSGSSVSWNIWESIIAGLIKFHPNAAHSYWVGLPPRTQKSIRDHAGNSTIRQYIAELDKGVVKDVDSAVDTINSILSQIDPSIIDEQFLNRIGLPSSQENRDSETRNKLNTPAASGSQLNTSGNANFYCHGPVTNVTLVVFPHGTDSQKLGIPNLINDLLHTSGAATVPEETENT